MKIVHLSTHDVRGGAATAAWRLHRALREAGEDSRMVVRTRHEADLHVAATDDGSLAAWHEQIITPWLRRHGPVDMPWFTVGAADTAIETHPWIVEADVLHLHWVAEWLSAAAVRRLAALGKPMLWTFHDLWPVTGGAHFAGSNAPASDGWQRGVHLPEPLRAISEREWCRKRAAWADLPVTGVSPSAWLARVVQGSAVGAGWNVQTVPNGIDTAFFTPGDRAVARAKWGIPAHAVVLLFGCAALSDPRKGFEPLRQALQSVTKEGAQLLLFGSDLVDIDFPNLHVGSIREAGDMASLYQAADAFLCPALEDNLPTTVIESLACGTPVLGFATGGVPDLVSDGADGVLVPCGDVAALARCLQRFVSDGAWRQLLGDHARGADKSRFTLQTQASRMRQLYAAVSPASSTLVADVAADGLAFTLLAEESGWLNIAAAEAITQARERERVLNEKLQAVKRKLRTAKASPPSAAKPAKPWWKFGQ